RREKAAKDAKAPGKEGEPARAELHAIGAVKAGLERGVPVRAQSLSPEARDHLRHLQLLTAKPVLYIANVDERQLADPADPKVAAVRALAEAEGAQCVVICGKVEAELNDLDPPERGEYLRSLGLDEPGLLRLVHASYRLLHLVTFFTVGPNECRAWTVPAGTRAPQAAGAVHTDFERGFIRAEVVQAQDLLAAGSEHVAREKALLRLEGRDYVVQDGDVIHFKFAV
ncbi:MAG TPA: DUF933 domain-containing protein, partial [Anaeromyxobacteraceae bacterium]|nr:DUF933 domain-containing protein [Anaeromyxobacteraceae bacterium]